MFFKKSKKKKWMIIDLGTNFLGNKKGTHYGGYVPYGLLCIASYLEAKGYPPEVLPLDAYLEESKDRPREEIYSFMKDLLKQKIRSVDPMLVALSMPYTFQYNFVIKVLEMIKQINPNLLTVLGGCHPSYMDVQCLEDSPHIDVVARGEGELLMMDMLTTVEQKGDLGKVKGITFRRNGHIERTEDREFADLDQLYPVNWGLIPKSFYDGRNINISPNRGCESKCHFCEEQRFWGNRVRSFPVERVTAEVNSILRNKYKYQFITMEDSMMDLNTKYFHELSEELSKIKNKRLGYMVTRVDSADDAGLAAAAKAGFFAILYGVETGSPRVMKIINKGITFDQVEKTLAKSKKNGIYNGTLWVVGLPGDSPEDSRLTCDFLEKLYIEDLTDIAAVSRFVPYPGTPIYANPAFFNVKILNHDWENWLRFAHHDCCELEGFSKDQIAESYSKITTMAREYEFMKKKVLKITDIIRY